MRWFRPAVRRVVFALTALALVCPAAADDTDHELYVAALAHERAVRTTLTSKADRTVYLRDARAVSAEYEALVRRYPASGYSDDALWHAGRLELDSFARFGEARDREAGVRLLQRLVAAYPTSKLVKSVPAALASASERKPVEKPQPVTTVTIRSITRTRLPDVVRIVIDLDGEVPFQEERATDPDRLVIDLARTRASSALLDQTIRYTSDTDLVRSARFGAQQNRSTRLVLDAAGVATYSIYALYNPYRLVVDCVRGAKPAPLRPLQARTLATVWAGRLPSTTPRDGGIIREATASLSAAANVDRTRQVGPTQPATPPADANAARGYSMARQLGLGVSRIVIDPGHGGHDPGAMGPNITEAELVLDIALRLEKLLQKVANVEVVLTRRTDDFVGLQERTAIANREGADLFLSIHANANENDQVRGIETYFLNFADNLSAAAVAARENAASGQVMAALPEFVKAIALNNKLDESREFATTVQRSMVERLRGTNKSAKDLGVKQAPFVVLIGAAMPSVLAEISFITNPQEARLLRGPAYRQRIAEALLAAIRKYQTSLRSVGKVAQK